MSVKRIDLLGVPVDCVMMTDAINEAESWILHGTGPQMIFAINPEKVIRAQRDPLLLAGLQKAGLLIPDGIGIVLAAQLLGLGKMERVPGSELMPALCERAAKAGYKVFLFGANQEVISQVARVLGERYPGLNVVGTHHGYVEEWEMRSVIISINKTKADMLFVALGSPKQELWMTRYVPQLKVKVSQGVGGTFDVIAGRVKRAPFLFRAVHLEWLYRLFVQPSRIFRQTALPLFAFQVLRKRLWG